jgi:hypothetical protein
VENNQNTNFKHLSKVKNIIGNDSLITNIKYNSSWELIEVSNLYSKSNINYSNSQPIYIKTEHGEGVVIIEIKWNSTQKATYKSTYTNLYGKISVSNGSFTLNEYSLITSFFLDKNETILYYSSDKNLTKIESPNIYTYRFSNFDDKNNPYSSNQLIWQLLTLLSSGKMEDINFNNSYAVNLLFFGSENQINYSNHQFDNRNYLINVTKRNTKKTTGEYNDTKITYNYF